MKATEAKLLDFLRKSPQFIIPIYQRTYSWTDKECRQLWDDIIRTGSDDKVSVHFIGSIVYIEKGISQVSSQSRVGCATSEENIEIHLETRGSPRRKIAGEAKSYFEGLAAK